jgi:hypothetical protein
LMKRASSREDRFQKPYSSSPGAGSLRTTVSETYFFDRRCTWMNGMKKS